ncbi:MAG: methylated-DNA--[protein]-cysteine S-methyltransferase [Clostridiales bacterium]|nr:methylated-DNA--[protein]-cysteine S-methyltransferase [Clostridiales bacterium]
MYYYSNYRSPLGNIILASNDHSIIGLYIGNHKYLDSLLEEDIIENKDINVIKEGVKWLDDYFDGNKPSISRLSLAPRGGEFRQEVWSLLLEIPYGQLTTYGDIAKEVARRMGKEKMSAQAVGGAIGHNPISIIIPCHRVVGKSGSLTGYGGGIETKVKLLEHEGVDMTGLFIPKKGTAL